MQTSQSLARPVLRAAIAVAAEGVTMAVVAAVISGAKFILPSTIAYSQIKMPATG